MVEGRYSAGRGEAEDAAALLRPEALARLLGGRLPDELPGPGRGVAYDSRRVRPGDVFFARQGSAGHGVVHADAALAAGAAFVVSDAPHPRALLVDDAWAAMAAVAAAARALLRAPVVGVTGSAGKTTVKTLLTAALDGRSTPGNLNTVPALAAALVEAARTEAGLDVPGGDLAGEGRPGSPLVLELGVDHPGEMAELVAFTRPDHAVLTTVGESHLSRLGDVAAVAREKSGLLAAAPGVLVAGAGAAAHLPPEVLARTRVARLLAAGGPAGDGAAAPPTDGAATDGAAYPVPPRGEVAGRLDGRVLRAFGHELELPWPGRAMAENALLVLTTARLMGVDAAQAFARMAAAPLEAGRLRTLRLGELTVIDDSYNSNPLSAALALEVLGASPRPRVAFLGDMRELGDVSRRRHLELGAATRGLDLVVAIGPEAAAVAEANGSARHVPSWAEAADLLDLVPPGATVLVKGSRSLGLERLVAAIASRWGEAAPAEAPGHGAAAAGGER